MMATIFVKKFLPDCHNGRNMTLKCHTGNAKTFILPI